MENKKTFKCPLCNRILIIAIKATDGDILVPYHRKKPVVGDICPSSITWATPKEIQPLLIKEVSKS